ncbi:MAG: GGDEF domain-containing protein [Nitriliruptoraceae bacterium]|nr:GGDEF domain-containing protein [Nitriliruptoraceae bacterium]
MEHPVRDIRRRIERDLATRKRRVYLAAIGFALVVTALSWLTRGPDDPLLTYGYPVLFLVLLGFALVLWRQWLALWPVEVTMLAVIATVILGRLFWHLHLAGPLEEHLLVLAGGHYWSVAVLVVGCFVMLDRRGGLVAGIAVLVVSAVLVATAVARAVVAGDGPPGVAILYLGRVHGFLAALLALVVAIASLREQLHRALARAEALAERATTDPITGLANRWSAEEALERGRDAANRYGHTLSVVLLDLDHFKRINDVHGHEQGDAVLEAVGRRLAGEVREVDTVARWGGEEFLVVAPETTVRDAEAVAVRCREALRSIEHEGLPRVTATFGVAELRSGETLRELLHRADELLYRGKDLGRDQVVATRGEA